MYYYLVEKIVDFIFQLNSINYIGVQNQNYKTWIAGTQLNFIFVFSEKLI